MTVVNQPVTEHAAGSFGFPPRAAATMLAAIALALPAIGLFFSPEWTGWLEFDRARIEGGDVPDDPRPPTFADGVATMDVLDAVRRSDREGRWADIAQSTRSPGGRADGA